MAKNKSVVAKPSYDWEEGIVALPNIKDVNPQLVGEAIKEIEIEFGEITPEKLVECAQNPKHMASVCSPLFDNWNRDRAAMRHWLSVARTIISSMVEIPYPGERSRPMYINIKPPSGKKGYRPTVEVIGNRELQEAALRQCRRDLYAWKERARKIKELCLLVEEIDKAEQNIFGSTSVNI